MPQQVQQITLIKGEKHADNVDYRDVMPINCSAIVRPILGSQGYMLQDPGLTSLGTGLGVDAGGVWNEQQELHFRVSGDKLVTVSSTGTVTSLGTVGASNKPAAMPYSTATQAVIINSKFYLYDATNGFREVIDPDLGTPIDGVWVDGYYFMTDGDFLFHTDIDDESSINPLKFSGSDFSPDPIVGVGLTTDNKVISFNRYSIEFFVNEATTEFAFTRIPSRNIEYGLVATHMKCDIGGQWFFVGGPKEGDVSVYAMSSGGAQEIASRDVVKILSEYSEEDLQNYSMEAMVMDGYKYLLLHLPDYTLKCNVTLMGEFGKELAWTRMITDTTGTRPFRGRHGVYDPRISRWVFGDKRSTNIGTLDPDVATHYGAKVECQLNTPFVYLETASIDELEITTIPGFNTTDDATVLISLTYDGVSYGTEASIDYGAPGGYKDRFIVYRLGYVDDWFSMRLRWISTSRMAFSTARLTYG